MTATGGGEMLAARFDYGDRSLQVVHVDIPAPGPGEVRVRVRAAGVCLTDVHLIDGTMHSAVAHGGSVTPGHEVAGEVEMLGEGASGVLIGDRVVVIAGLERDGRLLTMGLDYDGGWAEFVVVPVECVVPIPDTLPFDQAAIVPDAVSTPWGAIEATGRVRAGEAVGVWGIGGLGVHAVQLLRLVGASPIVAVDPSPSARDRGIAFGADAALDPSSEDFASLLAEWTQDHGLAVAFDFAGARGARTQALESLGYRGRLVVVGIAGEPIVIGDDLEFQYLRKTVVGHYGYDDQHLPQLVDLLRLGRLDLSASVSLRLPLAEAAQAVDRLRSKRGDPVRIVLIP